MKNLSRIYIISWFGNSDIRDKRVEYHNKQIEWAKSHNLDIFVLAQHYNKDEYRDDVTYIDFEYPAGMNLLIPGTARNVCLEHFYASDENFAIFADNDAVLYDGPQHCDGKDFVEKFNAVPLDYFSEVDLFVPLNPRKMPFTKTITDNQQLFDNNFVFHRNPDAKGSLFCLKNMRLHYNNPIYFDDAFDNRDGTFTPMGDVDFGLNFLSQGYSSYMLHNIILKEFAVNLSTWTGRDERVHTFHLGRNIMTKKYGLELTKRGGLHYKPLYEKSKTRSKLIVPKK